MKIISSEQITQVINDIDSVWVNYGRLNEIAPLVKECLNSRDYIKPRRLCLFGRPGVGKTEAIKDIAMPDISLKEICTNNGEVVYVKTPDSGSKKGLPTVILGALGDGFMGKGSRDVQTARIAYLIERQKIKLLILDEFHHFLDRQNTKVLFEISDWLKNLADNIRAGIILIGLPEAVEVLKVNEQLTRRFNRVKVLEPFGWDGKIKTNEFCFFLKQFETVLPFGLPSNLADPCDLGLRFYYATEGVADYVKKLVSFGTKHAIENGIDSLSCESLAAAYENELSIIFGDKNNPFLSNIDVRQLPLEFKRVMTSRGEKKSKSKEIEKIFGRSAY